MGNSSGNFKSNVESVDIELDFEIDPNKGQDEIRKFGYYFNAKGECRSIETEERVGRFPSQKKYEEFGAALERYIFFLLRDQYNMTEKLITSSGNDNKSKKPKRKDQSQIDKSKIAKSRIFLSPDYGEKQTLLLLIPGSGAVRAGQWARSICINDNLAAGCMYPFIAEAYKRDWGLVLFDPNGRTEKGRIFSDEHVSYVYDRYIETPYLSQKECKIKNVLIVCHSAGGMATTRLLNDRRDHLLPRIRAVAGTDTFFGKAVNKEVQKVYKSRIVNWVSSSQPLGTILSETVPKRVSAGHSAHEYTSASAFPHIFNFFDAMMKMQTMNAVEDKSLKRSEEVQTVKDVEQKKEDDNDGECVDQEMTTATDTSDKTKTQETIETAKDTDTTNVKEDDPKASKQDMEMDVD